MNGIRIKKGNRIAALCVLFLTLVSCGKTTSVDGTEISFEAKSEACLTKTTYGELLGRRQCIDWEEGDLIRIHSLQAQTVDGLDWADYQVGDDIMNYGVVSVGYITPVGNPLLWWDNAQEYSFYALYPSPSTPGMSRLIVTSNDHGDGKAALFLPGIQSNEWEYSGSSVTGSPDMRYAFSFACTRRNYGSMVSLTFTVLFSAFQFQFTADEIVHLSSFKIKAVSSTVAGDYDCDLTPDTLAPIYTTGGNITEITVPLTREGTLGGTPIEIPAGGTLDFIVFTTPADHKDFTITLSGTEFGTRSLDLKYSNGELYTFWGFTKYLIYGLTFPTNTRSHAEPGTKSPIPAGSPEASLEDGVEMRDGVICLNMADEKFNHEWY